MSGTSKNPDNAKKLLHAMTNVEDRYIQEAMAFAKEGKNKEGERTTTDRKQRAKTLRFQRNVGVIVALAACLALVFVSARVTGIIQPKGMGTTSSAPAEDLEAETSSGTAEAVMEEETAAGTPEAVSGAETASGTSGTATSSGTSGAAADSAAQSAPAAAGEFAASAGDGSVSSPDAGDTDRTQNSTATDNAAEESAMDSADAGGYADAEGSPYQEVSSLAEAEAVTGFSMQVPATNGTDVSKTYTVINGDMIEVTYSPVQAATGADTFSDRETTAQQDARESAGTAGSTRQNDEGSAADNQAASSEASGTGTYYIRKAAQIDAAAQDISGDYNTYPDTVTLTRNGITITLKGDKTNDAWSVATWSADGFDYAIGAQDAPMTQEQILSIAAGVK